MRTNSAPEPARCIRLKVIRINRSIWRRRRRSCWGSISTLSICGARRIARRAGFPKWYIFAPESAPPTNRTYITGEFGTPEQDALRRDACVNALFYNLMTQSIEDFTGRGLQDLHDRVIRTPLAPYETFKDDPLRVLRLIRFAARLSFTILPSVEITMMNEDIKAALRLKISRERVGVEIEKMLKNAARAYDALSIISRLQLFDCIFESSGVRERYAGKMKDARFAVAIDVVKWLLGEDCVAGYPALAGLASGERERYVAWLFAAGTPWAGVVGKDGRRTVPVAASGARDGLKLSNRDFESLVRCFGNVELVRAAVEELAEMSRAQVGHLIRELGSEWRLQVFAALVLDIVELGGMDAQGVRPMMEWYVAFVERVDKLGLADAWDLKPLLTGTEVQAVLERKAGRWMKGALERVIDWQLSNPEGTKEEAREFVKSIAGEIQDW
ncbi:CCA tRNA nucleotidyltransferase, mitochondrial, variant 2 [Orbilia brochopaga]|uniref:CCA tRNA nucleotidyltransferase, mitochondrial, variant 2 n=1 Tax=Orbilia brochopaga TaxID=3140254 RepID=A0AAV9TYX6_9PEZI